MGRAPPQRFPAQSVRPARHTSRPRRVLPGTAGAVGSRVCYGPAAAAYAGRVREIMENAKYGRATAAITLWAITCDASATLAVLEQVVVRFAGDDDHYGDLSEALHGFLRIGTVTPAARRALRLVAARDLRLSNDRDYRAILDDQELRSTIDAVLALP